MFRLSRDLHRHRVPLVFVAMEALDQLLLACHAQQINLFVESFIKMVGDLLESQNLEFQALATNSFVKFCQIEEDTASYHRRYDFFVSKFSEMCYHKDKNSQNKTKSQWHGVKGIQGVIRKTVNDDLQANIWQKQHMDKIIPALLYVIMTSESEGTSIKRGSMSDNGSDSSENPSKLAEECIQELLSRATFSNCGSVLKPALAYMDSQNLWSPDSTFAIKVFKIFMYSVQGQYSHVVVKSILDHLDLLEANEVDNKSSLLNLLQVVVKIPSSTPIGPAVIEVFNQLFQNIERSLKQSTNQQKFQGTFLDTIGTLAEVLPEYQKLEAMVFFITKAKEIMHHFHREISYKVSPTEIPVLKVIFESLLQIATKYNETSLSNISSSLLEPLLKVSQIVHPDQRLISQKIVLQLLDRRKAHSSIKIVMFPLEGQNSDIREPTKRDLDFIERKLQLILHWLYDVVCLGDISLESLMLVYKTIYVISHTVATPTVIIDLCRVILTIQETALSPQNLAESSETDVDKHRCALMSLVYASMSVVAHVSKVSFFMEYVTRVLNDLKEDNSLFKTFDPQNNLSLSSLNKLSPFPDKVPENILFSGAKIQDCLPADGFDLNRIVQPFARLQLDGASMDISRSVVVDADSVRIDFMNTPETQRANEAKQINSQSITYDYFRKVMSEPSPTEYEIKAEKEKIAEHIKTSTFEQIMAEMQQNSNDLELHQILKNCDTNAIIENLSLPDSTIYTSDSVFSNIAFPSVCVI